MTRFFTTSIILGCVCSLLFVLPLLAETITDPNLKFTLELPAEFHARPDLVGIQPDYVHAFEYGEVAEDEVPVLLFIEKMVGVIGKEHLSRKDLPASFQGELFLTEWQGHEVDGFEIPETVDGLDTISYKVQIPLKGEAVQVVLFGDAAEKEALKALLPQILGGLDGETNWDTTNSSSLESTVTYGRILLIGVMVILVIGIVVVWVLSRLILR